MKHAAILLTLIAACASRGPERIKVIKTANVDGGWRYQTSVIDAREGSTLVEYEGRVLFFPGLDAFQGTIGEDGVFLRGHAMRVALTPEGLKVDGRTWPLGQIAIGRRLTYENGTLR